MHILSCWQKRKKKLQVNHCKEIPNKSYCTRKYIWVFETFSEDTENISSNTKEHFTTEKLLWWQCTQPAWTLSLLGPKSIFFGHSLFGPYWSTYNVNSINIKQLRNNCANHSSQVFGNNLYEHYRVLQNCK